jgi:hypothetical protein
LINLTYFPIFLYFLDFFQNICGFTSGRSCGRSAASRRTAAADRARFRSEFTEYKPSGEIKEFFLNCFSKFLKKQICSKDYTVKMLSQIDTPNTGDGYQFLKTVYHLLKKCTFL